MGCILNQNGIKNEIKRNKKQKSDQREKNPKNVNVTNQIKEFKRDS